MKYLSAKELADKWQVSPRYVQRLLHDGRIPGARKFERSWMIPEDAPRPEGPRKGEPEPPSVCPYFPCVALSTMMPMPTKDVGSFLRGLSDEQRQQYMADIAYLRGDYNTALGHWAKLGPESPAYICAGLTALSTSINRGDIVTFNEARERIEQLAHETDDPGTMELIDAVKGTLAVSLFVPELAPDWVKTGEVTCLRPEARGWALYIHAKYLQNIRQFTAMLSVARTTLALSSREGRFSALDIYLPLTCAAACFALGDRDSTQVWLSKACEVALPLGFVTPLRETIMTFGGELERVLLDRWPEHYDAVVRQPESVWKNWLAFHNELAGGNVVLALNMQEYRLAQYLTYGSTYAEAAKSMNISVSRVKDLVAVIYGKLGISDKRELKRFIL